MLFPGLIALIAQSLTIIALKVETASLVAVMDRSSAIIIAVLSQVKKKERETFWSSYSSFIDFVLQCHPQQCQYWWDDSGLVCWSVTISLELLWQ